MKEFIAVCLAGLWMGVGSANDWPSWRGPFGNGHAAADQDPPVKLGEPKWSIDMQGRSHGSIVAKGDRLFLNIALENEKVGEVIRNAQYCVCLNRENGEIVWATEIFSDGLTQRLNKKATWASTTPALDDDHIYVNFLNESTVSTTALDYDGHLVWQTDICEYKVHQGYGASPVLYKDLVLVSADNKLGGVICGMMRKNGEQVWFDERAKLPNYPSPVVLSVAGKDQLIMTGTDKVTSYNPLSGEKYWEIDGSTTECVTSAVTDGTRIFTSGGYPENHVSAVVADGSGEIAWKAPNRVYVPSMLVKDGYLYAVMDAGVAVCWDSATGEEKWKGRLGGNFSASPILVGDKIYAANESGSLFVYRASPGEFELLAENKIGDEIFATPTICAGEIYLRVAFYDGETRREKIVCYSK
ncbi:MAG: PQQ-binding-like beta-propeller repeat protein [Verrucomicrobiales bacterium]|nr:PQQ-binding-like beta-propeller repeat protein [Verrucomicrobiales bacterium]